MPEIRTHIEQSFLFNRMQIIFLELVPKVLESMPEAVLAARHLFAGPFLVHGADRVFDQKLLCRFSAFPMQKQNACMLIESNMDIASRMPTSGMRVQYLTNSKVIVRQDIENFNAVDAGLYIVPLNIFLALDATMQKSSSLSMAEALVASYGNLSYVPTEHNLWFSIDPEEQLLHVLEFNLVNELTPYNFTTIQPESSPPKKRKSIVLSVASKSSYVSTAKQSRPLTTSSVESFHGFVVNVAEISNDTSTPLLPPKNIEMSSCAIPSDIAKIDPNEYLLTIPLPGNTPSLVNVQQNAYLIRQPRESKFILAVPDDPVKSNPLRRLSQLPSDVHDVALEAKSTGNTIEMKLTVNTQVPVLGYMILMVALLSVSAQGAALQTLTGIPPLLKLFWRTFGSAFFFGVIALFSVYFNGFPAQ
ncbi:Drug/Metabolite Transporter (DMT) Superfamily, partial [Thraustotheca clavata]